MVTQLDKSEYIITDVVTQAFSPAILVGTPIVLLQPGGDGKRIIYRDFSLRTPVTGFVLPPGREFRGYISLRIVEQTTNIVVRESISPQYLNIDPVPSTTYFSFYAMPREVPHVLPHVPSPYSYFYIVQIDTRGLELSTGMRLEFIAESVGYADDFLFNDGPIVLSYKQFVNPD